MTAAGSRTAAFEASGIGIWGDEETYDVTATGLTDYAAATNDPIAAHRDGTTPAPVFAIVPVFDSMLTPLLDVVPMDIFGRVVHGEHDFHFHRPIRPGERLTARGRVVGYQGKPNGTGVVIHLESRDADDELVNEQYLTTFFRKIDAGESIGEPAPAHKFDERQREQEPVAVVPHHVDDDQTVRYSKAAGDPMPIHLDEQAAKDAGLPGIIAHGMCTMAFASWGVLTAVADSDSARLRRFAGRFAAMVFPGDDLTTRIWRVGTTDGATTYAFETVRGADVVLSDGLAVIAD